jgi:tetratricopeptide (TPR) repeat protein
VTLATGVLLFHEQRYAEAVTLLERASAGGVAHDWLPLARAAREVTQGWRQAESENFVVRYPPGKEEVLVPYLLETLEAERAALAKDLGPIPAGKVTVEVVEGTRALARLSTLTEEEIKTSGTIAICKFNKMMITSPKALLHGYEWQDTAAHEYVHHVVTRLTGNGAPIWLHEGIARWHESRWRGPGGEILTPWSAALLRDAARRNQLVTFAQMHPSMAKLPSQEKAALAFAEVAVAVEYLKRKGGPDAVRRVLAGVAGGRTAEQAVADALGVPYATFLEDWRRYLAERPLPVGGERELRRLRFQGDPKHGGSWSEWSEIPEERARRHARLGEIFRERGRWEPARQEFVRAARTGGAGSVVLAGRLAQASMRTGHDDDAEKALAAALRTHPESASLHVQMGRLQLKRRQWAEARQSLLLANRVDPFDPEIHLGLSHAARELGDEPTASRERRFADILAGAAAAASPRPKQE